MIRILIILTFLSITTRAQAQLIPDQEFDWFYKNESNCKNGQECKLYYVSAHQDPTLKSFSQDEFITALNNLYVHIPLEGKSRIIKLRLAFPLDSIPLILNAGIKNGEVSPNELELLHKFVASWNIKPAEMRGRPVSSICRIYIYWANGNIEKAIWRKALFNNR